MGGGHSDRRTHRARVFRRAARGVFGLGRRHQHHGECAPARPFAGECRLDVCGCVVHAPLCAADVAQLGHRIRTLRPHGAFEPSGQSAAARFERGPGVFSDPARACSWWVGSADAARWSVVGCCRRCARMGAAPDARGSGRLGLRADLLPGGIFPPARDARVPEGGDGCAGRTRTTPMADWIARGPGGVAAHVSIGDHLCRRAADRGCGAVAAHPVGPRDVERPGKPDRVAREDPVCPAHRRRRARHPRGALSGARHLDAAAHARGVRRLRAPDAGLLYVGPLCLEAVDAVRSYPGSFDPDWF